MIKVKRIDHVAIAVADRDASSNQLEGLFGLAAGAREHVAGQKTDVAFLHAGDADADAASLELCAPAGNESLQRFLDKRGPGLHHVCFEVDDLPGDARDPQGRGRAPHRRDAAPRRARPPRGVPSPGRDGRRSLRAVRRGARRRADVRRATRRLTGAAMALALATLLGLPALAHRARADGPGGMGGPAAA